jgi:hypothetical protein
MGGEHYNGHTNRYASLDLTKHQKIKLRNADQGSTLVDDADLDLEEEGFMSDDLNDAAPNKFFAGKCSLSDRSYFAISHLFSSNYRYKGHPGPSSFCSYSSPIYIAQRALRL